MDDLHILDRNAKAIRDKLGNVVSWLWPWLWEPVNTVTEPVGWKRISPDS